jgi:hypothetical protein
MSLITTIEKRYGITLRKNENGELKKYMFLNGRWNQKCKKPNCFNYSYLSMDVCMSDGIYGYCNPHTPVRRKELRIKKLLDEDF